MSGWLKLSKRVSLPSPEPPSSLLSNQLAAGSGRKESKRDGKRSKAQRRHFEGREPRDRVTENGCSQRGLLLFSFRSIVIIVERAPFLGFHDEIHGGLTLGPQESDKNSNSSTGCSVYGWESTICSLTRMGNCFIIGESNV